MDISMAIRLEPITKDNWRAAIRLDVAAEQKRFVAPNYYSIIEAHFEPDNLKSRAAYDGDELVGYTMYGYDADSNPRRYWIVRLMVNHELQGHGYGRAIMQQVIEDLKQQPGCDAIYISFVPENEVARALYSSLGFIDTGTVEDGETVYKLPLSQ
jgi:diamine N-acetyltransferase